MKSGAVDVGATYVRNVADDPSSRYAMGYDRKLCADVLGAFIGALKRSLRWRAKRQLGLRSVDDARIGAITFVQRADSALRLNVHFHTLALDGVYVRDEDGQLQFCALEPPTAEEVEQPSHGRGLDSTDSVAGSIFALRLQLLLGHPLEVAGRCRGVVCQGLAPMRALRPLDADTLAWPTASPTTWWHDYGTSHLLPCGPHSH